MSQGKTLDTKYNFFLRAQESGEAIDQYFTVLRKMSETCEFSTLKNSLIKDRIVPRISDGKTRERLLRISDLTLEKAIEWFDLQRQQKNSQRTWQATNPYVELEWRRKIHPSEEHPQPMKIDSLQARYLNVETVE